jgi:DNA-directed RNA polymerase specialized sigma24 family protein
MPGHKDERHERFQRLYEEHGEAVLRYARRRTSPEAAEDALAETFVVAWRRLERVPAEPRGWLLAVTRRVLANQRRGDSRREALIARLALLPVPDAPPEPATGSPLGEALARLSARAGLVAGVAIAIAVATALLPGRDESSPLGAIPMPVQAVADELAGPGILHVVTERTSLTGGLRRAVPLLPRRTEGWYALDGSAWRTRRAWTHDEFVEQVYDGRKLREFSSACGLLRPPSPRPAAPAAAMPPVAPWSAGLESRISPRPAPPFTGDPVMPPASPGELLVDLDRELTRGGARVLGRTTVDGVPAYEVAYGPGVGGLSRLDWHLFVSAERAALLQIEAPDWPDTVPMLGTRTRSDVPTFENQPANPRTARLLLPAREIRGPRAPVC